MHVNFESTTAGRAAIKALDTLDVYVFTMTENQNLKDALIEKAEKGYQFRTKLGKSCGFIRRHILRCLVASLVVS